MNRTVLPLVLLVLSNTFMTFAWYYHVKQRSWSMAMAIGLSWLIALPEYILQVPANRLGHVDHGGPYSMAQLKVMQEAITLSVFLVFVTFVAHEAPKWTDAVGFALVFGGVAVVMWGRS